MAVAAGGPGWALGHSVLPAVLGTLGSAAPAPEMQLFLAAAVLGPCPWAGGAAWWLIPSFAGVMLLFPHLALLTEGDRRVGVKAEQHRGIGCWEVRRPFCCP